MLSQNVILNRAPQHDDPLNQNLQALAEAAGAIPGHPVIGEGADAAFDAGRSCPGMLGLTTR